MTGLIEHCDTLPGISAVLLPAAELERAVLDLGAVLEGLVERRFEILLVTRDREALADLRVRAPALPFRVVEGDSIADGTAAAAFDLVFLAARDGQFDVRELNHLLDGIEQGADIAVGYRRRRLDAVVRQVQRWGWPAELDYAFALVRGSVWRECGATNCTSWSSLVTCARRNGNSVVELPVCGSRRFRR